MMRCGRFGGEQRDAIQAVAVQRGPRGAKKNLIATVANSRFRLNPCESNRSPFSNRNKISLSRFPGARQRGSQHRNQPSNFDFRVSIFEPQVPNPGSRCALCANLFLLSLAGLAAAERTELLCAA